MTDALAINGMPVQVRPGSSGELYLLGEVTRGPRGRVRDSRRASTSGSRRIQTMKYETPPLTAANARRLKAIIEGDGHVFSFESTTTSSSWLASSKALPAVYSVASTKISTGAKYGTHYLRTPVLDNVEWTVGAPPDGYTILAWTRVTGSGTWTHIIQRSDSVRWTDGVQSSAAPSTLKLVGGALRVGAGATQLDFDSVVYLPYKIDDSWAAAMYAQHSAAAWPALPRVTVTGERFLSSLTAVGSITAVRHEEWAEGGAWTPGEALAFSLMEE